MRLAVCGLALTLTGCLLVSEEDGGCLEADDCAGGELCTDVKVCAAPEAAPPWRIAWTVNGAPVSLDQPGDCAEIGELALTVRSAGDEVDYRPVPCALGRFEFRALPLDYDTAILRAFSAAGDRIASARGDRGEAELRLDLEL